VPRLLLRIIEGIVKQARILRQLALQRSSQTYQLRRSCHLANTANYCFLIVSAYRYIAITNLPITPVFVEYLGQFLIDFNQIYRHSSMSKNTSPCIF